ncbi:MAG TPA: OpgC domain-containing protein [Xanthobacteraceae bacterium]|nr:OpgC domain-containing protein [Xanthobacteraceae bacterium]
MPPVTPSGRDLRLDLFRGLALWLIFLDHIPSNMVSWITIRNYGFSDATEIFVFISGYTAAFVYGREMDNRGVVVASARILKRVWQIYVAHIFLFVVYMAEIAYVASSFDNPLYSEEMGILNFLKQPDVTMIQAMLLKFKPANMDVLPLYIVLLGGFPPMLWLLKRSLTLGLAASAALYVAALRFDWAFPAYPSGTWFFNPLAWQLLFVFGAWCALGGAERIAPFARSRPVFWLSVAYLTFAFVITMTWYVPHMANYVPHWLTDWMYPIDKSNLDVLRFAHFVALATITLRYVPRNWPALASPVMRPAIICGQHSLEIFCLGVFLAFAGHFAMVELSDGIGMQILVSALGIISMVAVAWLITWYKNVETKRHGPRQTPPNADLAGGEA